MLYKCNRVHALNGSGDRIAIQFAINPISCRYVHNVTGKWKHLCTDDDNCCNRLRIIISHFQILITRTLIMLNALKFKLALIFMFAKNTTIVSGGNRASVSSNYVSCASASVRDQPYHISLLLRYTSITLRAFCTRNTIAYEMIDV